MDRTVWASQYKRLLVAYGKPSNAEQMRIYFDALSGYDGDVVTHAVGLALAECRYFPTIAELVARCGGGDEADPLYPQFKRWQEASASDPGMPAITFAMFRHYVEGQR